MDNNVVTLIPAHNEAGTVGDVVRSVKSELGLEVVVIDDKSSDGTRKEAIKAGARVLSLITHMGNWAAIQTGFRYALKSGYDVALTIDADGQHQPESIALIYEEILKGEVNVTIGSSPERASRLRHVAWTFFRRLNSFSIQDLTSGLKAYDKAAMKLLLLQDAYLFDYQDVCVLLILRKNGMTVKEVPVPMQPRIQGCSRVFGNWFKVIRYMCMTSLLSVCKYNQCNYDCSGEDSF